MDEPSGDQRVDKLTELEANALVQRAFLLALMWEKSNASGFAAAFADQVRAVQQELKKEDPPRPELSAAVTTAYQYLSRRLPRS